MLSTYSAVMALGQTRLFAGPGVSFVRSYHKLGLVHEYLRLSSLSSQGHFCLFENSRDLT